MDFDRLLGLLYVCNHYHEGQWSRLYRLSCKIEWHYRVKYGSNGYELKNNDLNPIDKDDWRSARDWAAHYLRATRSTGIRMNSDAHYLRVIRRSR